MKKILTVAAAFAASTLCAQAQMQFSFGPGAGVNYSIHSSPTAEKSESRFGALITSQFDMQFTRSLALLVWVDFYSNMSVKEEVNLALLEHKISYFSIAPTLKYCVLRSPFYLFGGPGIGFKTVGKTKQSYNGFSTEQEISNMETRFDIRLGAGYEFYLSNRITFTPFATFHTGLTDVVTNTGWKIQGLQLGLVLRYNTFR
jgi:hypothetical protein